MANYQLTTGTSITRTADGASIPPDPLNRDYQAYLAWKAAGNTPDPVVNPTPSVAQLQAYADSKVGSLLSAMRSYTAGGVVLKSDATGTTVAYLLGLQQWGAANPTMTQNWVANDFTSTPITGAQFVALAPLVGAYAQAIYSTELAAVLSLIAAGTITTLAQVDAYGWTV
jgi:hypothetical protein